MSDRRQKLGADLVVPSIADHRASVTPNANKKENTDAIPIAHEVSKAARLEKSDYERLKQAEENGRIVQALPVNLIRSSRFVNRSSSYYGSERYQALRARIKASGKIDTPIKVRPLEKGGSYLYEVVYGHTRLHITRDLNWETIPGTVERLSDEELVFIKFRENLDRADLSIYDQARAAKELLEVGFEGDRKKLANAVGRSKQWISHQMTIADIPLEIMEAYPLLHQATYDDLAELGRAIKGERQKAALLTERNSLSASSASALVKKLCRLLQGAADATPERPRKASRVTNAQGQLIAEYKPLAKGGKSLRFPAGNENFADYVIAQMDRLYATYNAEK